MLIGLDPTWNSILVLTSLVALAIGTTLVMYLILSPGIAEFEANHEVSKQTKVFVKLGGPTAFFVVILAGFCYLLFYQFQPATAQIDNLNQNLERVTATLKDYGYAADKIEAIKPILEQHASRMKTINRVIGNYCFTSYPAKTPADDARDPNDEKRDVAYKGYMDIVPDGEELSVAIYGRSLAPDEYSFGSTSVAINNDFVTYNWRSRSETSLEASGSMIGYAVLDIGLAAEDEGQGEDKGFARIGGSWSFGASQGTMILVPAHTVETCR
ncbi:MAG: hypothetical protein WD100_08170 [Tistlia sp.]|uniref:hypothetical protein n=1 Tax=Tistlia sp. TaxID=3057121 RepID=UPI0034A4FDEC